MNIKVKILSILNFLKYYKQVKLIEKFFAEAIMESDAG